MDRENEQNALEELLDRATLTLRNWAYAHPEATEPTKVIRDITRSVVPTDEAEILDLAIDRGLSAKPAEAKSYRQKKPIDRIVTGLYELVESRLWEEWDMIVGERDLIDDFNNGD